MKHWWQWKEDQCPRCGQPEDSAHVWACKGEGTSDIWDKATEELGHWLRHMDTDPTIAHLLLQYIKGWRSGSGIECDDAGSFREAVMNQEYIVWSRVLEGWLAKDWSEIQKRYYQLIRSRKMGKRWVMALIRKLWETAWDLWEHRNGILHEQENTVTRSMGVQLNQRITRVYVQLSLTPLRFNDCHILSLPLSLSSRRRSTIK